MKHFALIVLAAIAFSGAAGADEIFYDLTFSSPEHTVGSVPVTGSPPTKPSEIVFGRPIVASALGSLRNQPLVFNTAGNSSPFYYDQMALNLGKSRSFYYVAFDLYTQALIGSRNYFAVLFDTPTVRNIYFKSDGSIELFLWGGNPVIGSFADNSLVYCEVHLDMVKRRWTIFVNGSQMYSGPFSPDADIESIRFCLGVVSCLDSPSHDTYVGLDNIIVADYVVPRVLAPVAHAGEDQLTHLGEGPVAAITLDGSRSYDPGNAELSYEWLWVVDGELFAANGVNPTIELPAGEHVIELVVNNGECGSEPDEVLITVVDVTPPVLQVSVAPSVLWPANNKMFLIAPTTVAWDNSGYEPQVRLVTITNNEAEDRRGNRKPSDDILVDEQGRIYLRATRNGPGAGRVYTLTYEATDACGNSIQTSATVAVPHEMNAKSGSRPSKEFPPRVVIPGEQKTRSLGVSSDPQGAVGRPVTRGR